MSMPNTVIAATTFQDFACVLNLRKKVFLDQEGKFDGDLERLIDKFDDGPGCYNLLAKDSEGKSVGTMRLNIGPILDLPFSVHFKPMFLYEHSTVSSTSALCIDRSVRNCTILYDIIKAAMQVWEENYVDYIVSTVNSNDEAMWTRIGFTAFCEPFYVEEINDRVTPMWISFEALKTKFKR